MGVVPAAGIPQYLATYGLLTVVLLFTALTFVPIGQLCGRLLDRLPQLQAYGWNKGWALLINSGGNMGNVTERSFGVPEAAVYLVSPISRASIQACLIASGVS